VVRLRRRQIQLAEDGRDVLLDGPLSDRKVLRQRTIGTPFGDQLQHLAFAWSQSVQNGGMVPAADQLTHWADRVGADVVRGQEGADPGSVVFDAVDAAGGRGAGVVLVDTAGRMHTKVNLMEELKKIRRIAERTPGAPQEVLLVIDATTGQNGLAQARQFTDAVGVTGVAYLVFSTLLKSPLPRSPLWF